MDRHGPPSPSPSLLSPRPCHPAPVRVAPARQALPRDRSIDVLRGFSTLSMVLVNTCAAPRPAWLSHAIGLGQPMSFADTLFPCFLFTAGLAEAKQRRGSGSSLQRAARRALKLSALGLVYNDLVPRLCQWDSSGCKILELSSFRLPSVLSRIGIGSVVSSLEHWSGLPPPTYPALLGMLWYLLARRNGLDPIQGSTQAKLDRALFGKNHLHDPLKGSDPEGLLGSLFTAPISVILGGYLSNPPATLKNLFDHPGPLLAAGILSALFTGLIPSPTSKSLWTPTFVGQSTSINLVYYSLAKILAADSLKLSWLVNILEKVGARSLEIYMVSNLASQLRLSDLAFKPLDHLLNLSTILSPVHTNLLKSSLVTLGMIPVAVVLEKVTEWKL